MANLTDILHDIGQMMPGNSFFSNTRFGQLMSAGIPGAVQRNDWRGPYTTSDQTSIDDIAGMGSQGSRNIRFGSRLAGLIAALYGGGSALGGEGAGEAGGGGAGGVEGTGALEGGSASNQGLEGLSETTTEPVRLPRNIGNMGGTGGYAGPVDNSMIAPVQISDPFAQYSDVPPGLLALLLANQARKTDTDSNELPPLLSSGSLA